MTQNKTGGSTELLPVQDALLLFHHNAFKSNHDVECHNAWQPTTAGYVLVLAKNTGEDHHQHGSHQGGKTHCVDSVKDGTKRDTSTQIKCQPEDASVSVNPQPTPDQSSQSRSSPNICGSRLCFDPAPSATAPK